LIQLPGELLQQRLEGDRSLLERQSVGLLELTAQ
jgi:hypothetical protein